MLSILMLGRYVCVPACSTFMDGTWWLLVSVKTAVDLQLLPTRCAVIQLAMNRLRQVSIVLTWHFFQRNAIQFSKYHYVLESTCLVEGHLHFDKSL